MKLFYKIVGLMVVLMMLFATVPVSATETNAAPTNLLPEDIFSSPEKAEAYFGRVSTDPADYTKEGDDYVMHVPFVGSSWSYSKSPLPDGSYTIKMEVSPVESIDADGYPTYYGAGIVLGYGSLGGMPWLTCRFNFDYDFETVECFVWDFQGATQSYHSYGTSWYEEWEFPEDLWFEVTIEVTPEETRISLNGFEVPAFSEGYTPPAESIDHYPTSEELSYIGFFSNGGEGSNGFKVKNLGIYEGVDLDFEQSEATQTPTAEPTAASTETPASPSEMPTDSSTGGEASTVPSADATPDKADQGGNTVVIILSVVIVMLLAVIIGGFIFFKKRK